MIMTTMELLGLAWVVFMILVIVLRMIRRTRRNLPNTNANTYDWALADLRKLVAAGQISEEEFERAKAVILSRQDARFEPAKGFPVLGPVEQGKEPPKVQ